jgi:hypothetical protein
MTSPDVTLKRRQTGNTNPLAHCPQKGKPAKLVENCPHTGNSAICLITGTGSSAKSLAQQAILPNHWHTPPHAGNNSAKSLALKAGNSAKSLAHSSTYRQFCQISGTSSTYRQFCQITGTLLHKQETILPYHWHSRQFCQITGEGNSAKSLAHSSTYRRQFCQITGTAGNSANFLACFSTYRQFCQISGTLSTYWLFWQITGTGNSAKSLAQEAILLIHWHTPSHTGVNSAKSLARSSI